MFGLATQSLKMSFSCVGHDKLIFELTENYVDSVSLVRWFPSHERASAIGICMGGFHLGNVVGLLLTPIMLSTIGISGPFILFSSLGLLWLSTWTSKVTNDPCNSPFVSKSELRLIQAGKSDSVAKKGNPPSLQHLLSKLPSWTVIIANITNNWVSFLRHDVSFALLNELGFALTLLNMLQFAGILCSSIMDAYIFQYCKSQFSQFG